MTNWSRIPQAVLCVMVIVSPLQEGGGTHFSQMVLRLLLLLCAAIVAAQAISAGCVKIPMLSIRLPLIVFWGLAVVSTWLSPYRHPSYQWLIVISMYGVFLYLLVMSVEQWTHSRMVVWVILVMGLGEAALVILQKWTGAAERPSGTFFNPNFLAGYLAPTWALLLSTALYGYRKRPWPAGTSASPLLWWGGIGAALVVSATAILLTASRGGILVALVVTATVTALRFGWRYAAVGAALIVGLMVLVPSPLRDRVLLEHRQNATTYARWSMWQGAVSQMMDRPFGIGLGLYQYTYPRYAFPVEGEIARYGHTAQTPHNDYLQIGIEMGLGALLVVVLGIVMVGREFRDLLRKRLARRQRALIVGLGSGAVGLLVQAAFDSSLRESAIALLLVVCVGLIIASRRMSDPEANGVRAVAVGSRPVWGAATCAVLIIVGVEVVRLNAAWSAFEAASHRAAAGATESAIGGLRDAIALDPGKSLYRHGLGSLYAGIFEATGDKQALEGARTLFQETMALNPLDYRVPGLLGALYTSAALGRHASALTSEERTAFLRAAVEAYEREIALAPFWASPRYEQARLYWALADRGRAERRAREAVELEPNYLGARVLLARVCAEMGRPTEADKQIQEVRERQAQYHSWPMNRFEQALLAVDPTSLRVVDRKDTAG